MDELEQKYPDFPGLNLSWEVREGLVKHYTAFDHPSKRADFCREKFLAQKRKSPTRCRTEITITTATTLTTASNPVCFRKKS